MAEAACYTANDRRAPLSSFPASKLAVAASTACLVGAASLQSSPHVEWQSYAKERAHVRERELIEE